MYPILKTRRLLALALCLAMALTLTACQEKSDPGTSSGSVSTSQPDRSPEQEMVTPLDEILSAMAQAGLEDYDEIFDMALEEILTQTKQDLTMVVVRQTGSPHAAGMENLIAGLWSEEQQAPTGDVYTVRGDTALHAHWQDQEGLTHLLLSNTSTNMGYETGSDLLYFTFDGQTLTPVADLPQGFLYEGEPLPAGWEKALLNGQDEFWTDLRAVPYPGGVELYSRNPEYSPMADPDTQPRQWLYLGYVALDGIPLPLK